MTAKEKLQELVTDFRGLLGTKSGIEINNSALLELQLRIAEAMLPDLPGSDKLKEAAMRVVEARHYNGDDGWDKLKNAIAELEACL